MLIKFTQLVLSIMFKFVNSTTINEPDKYKSGCVHNVFLVRRLLLCNAANLIHKSS